MKGLRQLPLWILIVLCGSTFLGAQKPRRPRPSNRKSFGSEIRIKNPVKLPESVLQNLRGDDDVKSRCLTSPGPGNIQPAFFVGSRIQLGQDSHPIPGLIVTDAKDNPCLGGANIDPLWIFYSTSRGYQLGLRLDTHNLDVLKTSTRGLSDIRSIRVTGTELLISIFKFDGIRYKIWRSWRKPITLGLVRGVYWTRNPGQFVKL